MKAGLSSVKEATLSTVVVSQGSRRTYTTHEFYRYPARFSPQFAAAVIDRFTERGDLVLDPFVGGGTTLVEALTAGRRAIGSDLNELAIFVSGVKATPLRTGQLAEARRWIDGLEHAMDLRLPEPYPSAWAVAGYLNQLDGAETWRIRKLIAQALSGLEALSRPASEFCRCVVLRTAQWALDMRQSLPSATDFKKTLIQNGEAMIRVISEFSVQVGSAEPPLLIKSALPGLADRADASSAGAPRLILTSPPYPGVYVNYHRWKLLGRKEIRAPYWIADRQDGHGLAHYTMSARAEPTLNVYFGKIEAAYRDLARLADRETLLVQLVGFNDADGQLPRFLSAMGAAGFSEVRLDELATADDGRLWRDVPGRRWWTQAASRRDVARHTSREVVLVHRLT